MSEATILSLIQVVIGLLDLAVGLLALCKMGPPKSDSERKEPTEGELEPNHED